MLTLEEIKTALQDRNLRAVSENTGVYYQTLVEIANGKNTNPSYKTLKALSDYLEGKA
jgi:transcriptional regulator with XRE-family HTH domain